MSLTDRETWAALHGVIFGALFLLAFAGGFASLYSLKSALVTPQGIVERTRRMIAGTWAMAVVSIAAVVSGAWIVYPWYRAAGKTSPKSILLANPGLADWHNFGMEWKEHIAWFAPLLATTVALVVTYYGKDLIKHQAVRRAVIVTFTLAFGCAAVAGLFGAFITKAAPVH